MSVCEGSIYLSLNCHIKEAEGNSHAVILINNGNQVHSQYMDKDTGQLLEVHSVRSSMHLLHQCILLLRNYAKTE